MVFDEVPGQIVNWRFEVLKSRMSHGILDPPDSPFQGFDNLKKDQEGCKLISGVPGKINYIMVAVLVF